jgi:hypothetical protein
MFEAREGGGMVLRARIKLNVGKELNWEAKILQVEKREERIEHNVVVIGDGEFDCRCSSGRGADCMDALAQGCIQ